MAVSGNLKGKFPVVVDVLFSHEIQIYPTTSLDENCIVIEFQSNRSYYIDLRQTYLASKLKFVRSCGHEAYNIEKVTEEHKEEAKADVETEEGKQEAPATLVTNVKDVLVSIFPNIEVHINN